MKTKTIQQVSEGRVGNIWRDEDHLALCRAIEEINRTAEGMVKRASAPVRRDPLDARSPSIPHVSQLLGKATK